MYELRRNIYKDIRDKDYMDIGLGSKDPRREISLGRTGSIIFILIFLIVMGSLGVFLAMTFVWPEDAGETYIKCNTGEVEKITKGVTFYCGEETGADTVEGINNYIADQDLTLETLNIDFNLEA